LGWRKHTAEEIIGKTRQAVSRCDVACPDPTAFRRSPSPENPIWRLSFGTKPAFSDLMRTAVNAHSGGHAAPISS
jgi:hypothetical protein